jgi:AAA15 family ATPase/GTPase
MKILELFIKDIRGIREEIKFEPNGDNFAVFGPNGTGKSAVVDSLDFLLTGNISRLTGRGSQGMSIKEHGPHIDAEPKDAIVSAKIKINGINECINLSRCFLTPNKLECDGPRDNSILKEVLETAKKGQHVLSRAEILKFISAEAGKRSEEIQAILDISKIEEIRKAFVTIKRDADKQLTYCKSNYDISVQAISHLIGEKEVDCDIILAKINDRRKVLKGDALITLVPGTLKENISVMIADNKNKRQPEPLKLAISDIRNAIKNNGKIVFEKERKLRASFKQCKSNDVIQRDLKNKRLLDLGVSLIEDSGACPLCLTAWPQGELSKLLSKRILGTTQATELLKNIETISKEINEEVSKQALNVLLLLEAAKSENKTELISTFNIWTDSLKEWKEALINAVDNYSVEEPGVQFQAFLSPDNWITAINEIEKIANAQAETNPVQNAWDLLTSLDSVLERYLDEKNKYENAKMFAEKASILETAFTATKDAVLEELYNSIRSDFASYYRLLHGIDEMSFQAEMKPSGAQLDFKVDFFGRGMHPPRALHSEGHQDSMGLCLFLALNKKICAGKVQCVILDDVVMSIDSEHRRSICRLLINQFPDVQFLITTHNRTWARQLNTDGVVKIKNMYEFRAWNVDTGPLYGNKIASWDEIRNRLEANDVSSAAHLMREHLEFIFENVCSEMHSMVAYKSDSRYELGDFLSGVKSSYRSCLKKAKVSANSWNKQDQVKIYAELETQFKENVDRSQSEQWAVNENVHYNKWADFTKADLLPVIEAFQDFEEMFKCSKCGGFIGITQQGYIEKSVKCPCGNISWNLEVNK